jgi:hypothetical protein
VRELEPEAIAVVLVLVLDRGGPLDGGGSMAAPARPRACSMRDNKYDDAEALLKQAYVIEERADTLYYLWITDLMRGRCRDARTTCELVTKKWPGDPLAKAAADTDLRIVPDSTIAGCYRAN